jgi:hypothetical protein
MAFNAMKPPIDKPQRMALSIDKLSINFSRSSANKSIVRAESSSFDFPNPRISQAMTRWEGLKKPS